MYNILILLNNFSKNKVNEFTKIVEQKSQEYNFLLNQNFN